MSAPTLIERLTVEPLVVRVEPPGSAPVTMILQPLGGASQEARSALRLGPGPGLAVTWASYSDLGHEAHGGAILRQQPRSVDDFTLWLTLDGGLSVDQAQACAAALWPLLTWEE